MRPTAVYLLTLSMLAGCGGGPAPLPSNDAARQALRTSLDAWKAGKPASSLAGEKPSIEAVDFEWKAGKILTDYTLGDEAPGQGTQTLSATLTLKGQPPSKPVRYMVLGLDPVRVYRDEDFNRAMAMDNAPSASPRPTR